MPARRAGDVPAARLAPSGVLAPTRARLAGLAGAGLVAALVAAFVTMRSDVLAAPVANGVFRALVIASWIGVGLVTWKMRPASRLGLLFVAAGFVYVLTTPIALADPDLFTLGRVAWAFLAAVLAYVLLAFPRGSLEPGAATWIFRIAACGTLLLWTPLVLGARELPIGGVLTRCAGSCPENPFRIADMGGTANSAISRAAALLTSAILLAVAIRTLRRLRAVSGLSRNTLVPPLVCVLTWALAVGASNTVRSTEGDVTAAVVVGWVGVTAALCVPFALLFGQVRGRLFAGAALRDALPRLARLDGRRDLRSILAEVLQDRSLELFFWVPSADAYADAGGRSIALGEIGDRSVTEIRRGQERVAAIVYDQVLDETPGLVDAIGAGALLSLENAGLEEKLRASAEELRASAEELRASRARIVSASAEERRRIERDLHDSAQNRLVALRVKLGLAEERAADTGCEELHQTLVALGEEAQDALDSVRAIAHGIYPSLLATRGLGEALAAEVDVATVPVRLVGDEGMARSTPDAEAAVYFCCLEAIQNAVKHAGQDASITIRVRCDGDSIAFSIEDDGAGFDQHDDAADAGLANMRDRISAAGGDLEVTSERGGGTTVSGTAPWPARPRTR